MLLQNPLDARSTSSTLQVCCVLMWSLSTWMHWPLHYSQWLRRSQRGLWRCGIIGLPAKSVWMVYSTSLSSIKPDLVILLYRAPFFCEATMRSPPTRTPRWILPDAHGLQVHLGRGEGIERWAEDGHLQAYLHLRKGALDEMGTHLVCWFMPHWFVI